MENKFTLTIIFNGYNQADIKYYASELKIINRLFKDKVDILVLGLSDVEFEDLKGVQYNYTKAVSINHWFKQLHILENNIFFIPLIKNEYNESSEEYKKFEEVGMLGVPIIAPNIHPYDMVIRNNENGFIFQNKESFIDELKVLLVSNMHLVKICGQAASNFITSKLAYNEQNVADLNNCFD